MIPLLRPCTRSLRLAAAVVGLAAVAACIGDPEDDPPPPDTRPPTSPDTRPPTSPGPLRAEVLDARRVSLSWTAATDDVGVTGYRVFRGGALVATVTDGLSYVAGGLADNTLHAFAVQACDAAGNCSVAAEATARTPVAPPPLDLDINRLLIEPGPIVGTNDAARRGVAYAGPPVEFGPYTVHWLGTPGPITGGFELGPYTSFVVDGRAPTATASPPTGSTLVMRVDFAAFAAAAGGVLPYAKQYLPAILTPDSRLLFGGPGSGGVPLGGIITCSDPLQPPLGYTTPCP